MTQQNQEYTLHSQILLNPEARSYPCLCLCFGFSQMILIAPLRLMTLHFSQIGLTDALTFTIFSPFQNVRQLLYHLSILKASTILPKNDKILGILQSNHTKPFNLFISQIILPFVKSYGESSIVTLSPGKILIKFIRNFPLICPST